MRYDGRRVGVRDGVNGSGKVKKRCAEEKMDSVESERASGGATG